jgi:hypothetical protein
VTWHSERELPLTYKGKHASVTANGAHRSGGRGDYSHGSLLVAPPASRTLTSRGVLHEESLRSDLTVLVDLINAHFLELHPPLSLHRNVQRQRHGDGVAGDERL